MTIGRCLANGTARLKQSKIKSARLDTLIILENVIGRDRAWLLANQDFVIAAGKLKKINKLLKQRESSMPLAYILNQVEFYGRKFVVNSYVLIPRPESETMMDLLLELSKTQKDLNKLLKTSKPNVVAADLGTGCGALGITASLVMPKLKVDLIDIDKGALEVAKINVDKYTLNIRVINSDLLNFTSENYKILLCNLPYVPDEMIINKDAQYEPTVAVFGGKDGLDVYRKLANQISNRINKPLFILIEAFPFQHKEINKIYNVVGYKKIISKDFIIVFKVSLG